MYSPPAPFGWGDSLWHQAECWLDYEVPEWAEKAPSMTILGGESQYAPEVGPTFRAIGRLLRSMSKRFTTGRKWLLS